MPRVATRRISARTLPSEWAEFCCDAFFLGVSSGFLRFRQGANPLAVVELRRGRVVFFLQEHQLRVEQEVAFFWQVSRGPLDRENVKTPEQAPPQASSCLFCFDLAPSSRSAPICIALLPRRFGPPRHTPHSGGVSPYARTPRMRAVVQFLRQSAEPCGAPPTNPFMALLMDPRAVRAQARFPRCSSLCGCTPLAVLRGGPELC